MKNNNKKQKKKGKFIARFFRAVVFFVLFFLLLSILLITLYRWVNPPFTPLMIIRKIDHGETIQKHWADIKTISPSLINCAVAAEDNNYLSHNGFDFGAIEKAIDERKVKGRIRGASTISQQTAKNVFLWQQQSWIRKGLEAYFTVLIELLWSKERIMEIYLNIVELGNGIYGVEAASNIYFNKNAATITPYQAALLIAALPSPLRRNPGCPSLYLQNRASQILALSAKIGTIRFDDKSITAAKERFKKRKAKK